MTNKKLIRLIPGFILFVLIFKFLYQDNGLNFLIKILLPIFTGILLAIILNPLLLIIQNKFKVKKRWVAILLTFLIFLLIISGLLGIIIPGLIDGVATFSNDIQHLFENLNNYIDQVNLQPDSNQVAKKLVELLNSATENLISKFTELSSSVVNVAISSVTKIVVFLYNMIMSFIFAIYILSDKEHFENLYVSTVQGLFRKKISDDLIKIGHDFYENITNFFSGKLIDSLIIGIITFVCAKYLIHAKFALIIAVTIGVTNMIPYFGPFIGGIPAVLLTVMDDPMQGLWMAIMVLVIQQFDGLFLGPKILGIKLSLRPLYVIIAITLGGAIAGPAGMFLATPVAALVKSIFEGYMTVRLQGKDVKLPHEDRAKEEMEKKCKK